MAKDKEKDFHGRVLWGIIQDYYRDKAYANKDVWMSWEELCEETQKYYTSLGDAMLGYFRSTEGNDVLRKKFNDMTERFETLRALFQKQYKESGGR